MSEKKIQKSSTGKSTHFSSYNRILPWLMALLVFLLYSNTFSHSYNLDDELVTRKHPLTSQGFKAFFKILSSPYYADNSGNAYEYRPIVLLTFAAEHQFFGDNPGVSHFLNVLLYAILIFVLFKALQALFNSYSIWLTFAVTLLFAVHPLHTEVVAGIKNRDEILALLFGLLALYAALKYIQTEKLIWIAFAAFLFLAGVLSKKSIMPFALVIPLAVSMFRKPSLKQILLLTIPLGAVASVTSHFFDINLRIFLFAAIVTGSVTAYIASSYKTLSDFKNDCLSPSVLFATVLSFSGFLLLIGVLNNSALLLWGAILLNIIALYKTDKKDSDIFLLIITAASLALLIQNGMVSPVLFLAAYLIGIFNFRNRLHIAMGVLLLTPLVFNFSAYLVIVFYFFLMAVVHVSGKLTKITFIKPLFALFLAVSFLVINLLAAGFQNETLFLTLAFATMALLSFPSIKKGPVLHYLLLIIIPLALFSEIFFLKGYNASFAKVHTAAVSEATDVLPASGRALDFAEMPLNSQTPLHIRMGTAAVALAYYMRLLIVPYPLGFYYGYDTLPIVSIANHWAVIALVMHLILLVWGIAVLRRRPFLSFAVLYYFICLSIFSNVLAPVAGVIAERLAFTASLGFSMAIAWGIFVWASRGLQKNRPFTPNKLFVILLTTITLVYAIMSFNRSALWKNHLTLFSNDIQHLKRSAQAHNLYASVLLGYMELENKPSEKAAMLEKAINHFRQALNIYPDFYNASYNLGKALYFDKRYDEAASVFKQTLRIDSSDYMVYMYLGIVHNDNKQYEDAEQYFLHTLDMKPDFFDASINLAALYANTERPSEAIAIYSNLLAANPQAYEPAVNIGKIYFGMGKLDQALVYFEKAFAINSTDKNLSNALYEINIAIGDTSKAAYYKKF